MGAIKAYLVRLIFFIIRAVRGFSRVSPLGMSLHPAPEFISDEIRRTKSHYEISLLTKVARLVRPGSLIDVGANIGNHCNFFQQLGLTGFAFEPSPRNFQLLTTNATNFKCHNLALGAQHGSAQFIEYSDSSGNGHIESAMQLAEAHDSRYSVAVEELDNFDCSHLAKPILLKIDVEGSELNVLKGGRHFLTNQHPVLWVEIHTSETLAQAKFPYSQVDIFSQITSLGYDSALKINPTNYLFANSRSAELSRRMTSRLLPITAVMRSLSKA